MHRPNKQLARKPGYFSMGSNLQLLEVQSLSSSTWTQWWLVLGTIRISERHKLLGSKKRPHFRTRAQFWRANPTLEASQDISLSRAQSVQWADMVMTIIQLEEALPVKCVKLITESFKRKLKKKSEWERTPMSAIIMPSSTQASKRTVR